MRLYRVLFVCIAEVACWGLTATVVAAAGAVLLPAAAAGAAALQAAAVTVNGSHVHLKSGISHSRSDAWRNGRHGDQQWRPTWCNIAAPIAC
jgi:hypothetical protein